MALWLLPFGRTMQFALTTAGTAVPTVAGAGKAVGQWQQAAGCAILPDNPCHAASPTAPIAEATQVHTQPLLVG